MSRSTVQAAQSSTRRYHREVGWHRMVLLPALCSLVLVAIIVVVTR